MLFVQRSGSSLNLHIHLHVVVVLGTFAAVVTPSAQPNTPADPARPNTPADSTKYVQGVSFHEATKLTDANIQAFADALTEKVRKQILRWMVKNNLLEPEDARDMLTWQGHGGFSIDASVDIPAHDRHGLERLLRYCASPPFAAECISLMEQEHSQQHDRKHSDHRPPIPQYPHPPSTADADALQHSGRCSSPASTKSCP